MKPFRGMKKYDTMKMGKSIVGRKFFKLKDLAKAAFPKKQYETINFHDAEEDAYVTAALFCALHKSNIKF